MAAVRAQKATSSNDSTSGLPHCSYDVFLSFRGEDTRKTFTDHLYTALVSRGIRTFRDDDEMKRGENIQPQLQKAIQQSQTSVVVISKDYASSRWCLDELVVILQRRRTHKHVVVPVFYDIDPSHVRKQTGRVAEAFHKHQKTQSMEKVNRWRAALTEIADLTGMVLQNQADGHESKFIKKIVKVIEDKITHTSLSVGPYLIGIHSQVKKINLWCQYGSRDAGILVICGTGGIGKTTIAKSVYNSHFKSFEGSCFLENIRDTLQQPNGLVELQIKLVSALVNERKVQIHSSSEGVNKIKNVISSKRVLLVLDDVDHMDQLDRILDIRDWVHSESKIIVTTRCPGLLKAHEVNIQVYNVETLSYYESLKLFSWYAFGQDHPIEGYLNYSEIVVNHCKGLPLALRTLGASMSGQNLDLWERTLEKLKVIPNSDILKKLRISYDSLQDDDDKNVFLHIACFFIGKQKDVIVKILDACEVFTIVGIQNLVDRCLVTIDQYNNVNMHQMIRDMGREIVRLENSKEPGKRSRLWHWKDSLKVLTEKNGTETIEGLVLDMEMDAEDTPSRNSLETNGFARMPKLRLLQLSNVHLSGSYHEEFPKGLRWLCWSKFSLHSIPSRFPLESLVVLEMPNSNLRQVWKGTEYLPSLKILDLSHSPGLTKTGQFPVLPKLERFILEDCASLVDVHESIGKLKRLVYLNIKDCKNIRKLPNNISVLKSLETLILSGCSNLNEFPVEIKKMESLKVLKVDEIPTNQLLITTGEDRSWPRKSAENVWAFFPRYLTYLSLQGCGLSDVAFPKDFGNTMTLLKSLDLSRNPICGLPDCIRGLTRLDKLRFSNCKSLKSLIGLPKVTELAVFLCPSLEKVTFQSFLHVPEKCSIICNDNLAEIGYWFKLEPIGRVDVEMITLLGLCSLESMEANNVALFSSCLLPMNGPSIPVQGLSEYGIFSTFLPGNEVPGLFKHKSRGSSLCFTMPLLPNSRVRGLNIFSVYSRLRDLFSAGSIITKVNNKSKGLEWIYSPTYHGIPGDNEAMIWLSHWKLENQLESGDEVTISVFMKGKFCVDECGVQVVYEQEENTMNTQDNTQLPDPSYPYIIGQDLSRYQLMPGTYLLYAGLDARNVRHAPMRNKFLNECPVLSICGL